MSNFGVIGVDLATESARAILLDGDANIIGRVSAALTPVEHGEDGRRTQNPQSWVSATAEVLTAISKIARQNHITPQALTISATSGTFVLVDDSNQPIAPSAMYNDGRASNPLDRALKIIAEVKPIQHLDFLHVPDFVIRWLTQSHDIATDWSHAMKTGVDLHAKNWNTAIMELAEKVNISLPRVVAPGHNIGELSFSRAEELGLPKLAIYAGMTDGCTGQISASGAQLGSAVTTLGTTLVLKVVGEREIVGPGYYSHLLPENRWLAGGASNIGGISLRNIVPAAKWKSELKRLDELAEARGPASFVTYPLIGRGERFPLPSREIMELSSGDPMDGIDKYRAILEGIAFTERYAYEILERAGAGISDELITVGGGARSATWCAIRATVMNRPIIARRESGSDLGAAMIALAAHSGGDLAKSLDSIAVPKGEIFSPIESELDALEESYRRFLELTKSFQES